MLFASGEAQSNLRSENAPEQDKARASSMRPTLRNNQPLKGDYCAPAAPNNHLSSALPTQLRLKHPQITDEQWPKAGNQTGF